MGRKGIAAVTVATRASVGTMVASIFTDIAKP